MQIRMEYPDQWDTEQIRKFVDGSNGLALEGQSRQELYAWVQATLVYHEYGQRSRSEKGLIRLFLSRVTGRSLPQIGRLIRQFRDSGVLLGRTVTRRRFPRKYTPGDVALLVQVDQAHQRLSGPATRRIFERELYQFGHEKFQRLAEISVSHLYNLRGSSGYRRQAAHWESTKPTQVSIAERRRPEPGDRPGYLRVDTVHQGDLDGIKGVYPINLVDEVTQWQMVACVAAITQSHLKPVLQDILRRFPFVLHGFHSDNGSEFINDMVSGLLRDLLIEQTKSRARKSNDNGLVESKNGAVIRKHMGYGYIAAEHAHDIHAFYQSVFNPYLNFHRPCGQPERIVDQRGKEKFVYKRYATPWETLRTLEQALPSGQSYLKPGISLHALEVIANAQSDTESARRMQEVKRKLFVGFRQERKTA